MYLLSYFRFFARSAAAVVLLVLGPEVVVVALQHVVKGDKEKTPVVCISLAAYEDESYIEALLDNFRKFMEPGTKLALHLNSKSDYDGALLTGIGAKWNTDQVHITTTRIPVERMEGSVLYAHLLNAKAMEERWPNTCDYYMIQASNMMWVRRGVEAVIRKQQYAHLEIGTWPHEHCLYYGNGTFMADPAESFWQHLQSPKAVVGHSNPEGAFFPMKMVRDFNGVLDTWLQQSSNNGSLVYEARCYYEADWLQTYAANWADPAPPKDVGDREMPVLVHLIDVVPGTGRVPLDSVPLDEVKLVARGVPPYDSYYGVKRIERDLSHPTTKFIVSLVP